MAAAIRVDDSMTDVANDEFDVFDRLAKSRKHVAKRRKKNCPKPIKIALKVTPVVVSSSSATIDPLQDVKKIPDRQEMLIRERERQQRERELEDTLSFFSETHEDQDPAFEALRKKLDEEQKKKKLEDIEKLDAQGRKEIDAIITAILKDKQGNLEKDVAIQKTRYMNEGKQRSQRLDQAISRRSVERRREIQKGIEVYKRRHQDEVNNEMREQQKRVHQQRLSEAAASKEWSAALRNLQAQQSRELADFRTRGEEVMKKMEHDYKREVEKNDTLVARKIDELQRQQQKMLQQFSIRHQQSRQRHLQRHTKMIEKRKLEILPKTEPGKSEKETQGSVNIADQRPELKQADPLVSNEPWVDQLENCGNAAARHKHRRTLNSQHTARQMSVEIHNEGVRLAVALDAAEEKKKSVGSGSRDSQDFIPWGAKAFSIMEAIIFGEIPIEAKRVLESHPNAAELMMNQGSQVRCVVFDLRTSETTASAQRAQAIKEHEENSIRENETKLSELNKLVTKADAEVKRLEHIKKEQTEAVMMAEQGGKEAQRRYDDFRKKYSKYFTADGNIIQATSEKNREELKKATAKYNATIEALARKLKMAKANHDETAARLQKSLVAVKSIQKNCSLTSSALKKKQAIASMAAGVKMTGKQIETVEIDRAATRVDDVIGSLHVVANKRRRNAEQSRTTSFRDKWVESMPELSSVVKDSLLLRMQRRCKHYIVLRPTPESLASNLRSAVNAAAAKWPVGKNSAEKSAAIDAAVEKAEQLFLLGAHPLASGNEALAPTSTADQPWAEPGCLLDLSVPTHENSGHLLPRPPSFELFERNLAEFSSSYGRQCASFTNAAQLRGFGTPLSCLGVAGSIAESNHSLSSIRGYSEDDPLLFDDDKARIGYTFRLAKARPSSPTKKKVAIPKSGVESPDAIAKRKATSKPPHEPQQKTTKKEENTAVSEPSKPSPVKRSPSTPSPRSKTKQIVDTSTGQALANRSTLSPGFGSVMQHPSMPTNRHSTVGRQQQTQQLASQRQQPQFQPHQMAHLQLMQQQQQSSAVSPRHQHVNQVNAGFPQQAIMQQLYGGSLGHANPMAHMHMQNHSTLHAQQQHHFQQQNQQRQQQLQQLQLQQLQHQQQQQQLQHQQQQYQQQQQKQQQHLQQQQQQQLQQQQQQQLQQNARKQFQGDAETQK